VTENQTVHHGQIKIEKDKKNTALFALATPFLVFGVLGDEIYFFLIGLLLYAILFITHLYLLQIYKPLYIDAKWSHTRLFPGEELQLHLQVTNRGRLGVQAATWYFKLRNRLEIAELDKREGELRHKYSSPVSLAGNEGVAYQLTATGVKRGTAQLEDINIKVSDPFGLGMVIKEIQLPKQEVIIYPELKSIAGLEELYRAPMGERSVPLFTHEDPTYILGARPYQYGDPFHRIDWKATAKKQELHTRLIDKTAHAEFVFIGNARTYAERWRGINEEYLERTLSVLASLSHHTVRQGMPYQVMINMKPVGRRPAFRIKRGEGRKHLIYTLEALARVSAFSTIALEEAVFLARQDYSEGKIFVVVTPYITDELQSMLSKMDREGIPVYVIKTDEEEMSIQKVGKGMKRYA
jgi:uncharacterized protein (DUF58 family)